MRVRQLSKTLNGLPEYQAVIPPFRCVRYFERASHESISVSSQVPAGARVDRGPFR